MSGITDLKAAFQSAAPGVTIKELRVRTDTERKKQIIEVDIIDTQGARTVTEALDIGMSTSLMCAALTKTAKALGATVIEEEVAPATSIPLAGLAAAGIANLMGGESEIERARDDALLHGTGVTVDGKHVPIGDVYHKGEEYELAHDGSPQTLFF